MRAVYFKGYNHRVSQTNVRRVWAIVTHDPQMSVRRIAQRIGQSSPVAAIIALRALRDAGYIDYADHSTGRTIIVPFIAIKKDR